MPKVILIIALMCFATTSHSQEVRVVEKSLLAKIAGKINRQENYAITIGKTIFISCRKEEFFEDQWWVNHELAHVKQYKKYGTVRFLALYTYYTLFRRKSGNPFERDARAAENSSGQSLALLSPVLPE